jgi:hypothetical protein
MKPNSAKTAIVAAMVIVRLHANPLDSTLPPQNLARCKSMPQPIPDMQTGNAILRNIDKPPVEDAMTFEKTRKYLKLELRNQTDNRYE